ncbi:MAG: hypothetical protein KC457_31930, partial [Myxococcales bacterium]|nr:hypothetical protein [Myxococcales bacterium]
MTRQARTRALVLAIASLGSLGCAELEDRARFESVVGPLEIAETIPAAGATDVDPLTRIDLCMSAEVDPRALAGFDATLRSGNLTFDTDVEVQLVSWRAPGARSERATEGRCLDSGV